MSKSALGRGLDSLLPPNAADAYSVETAQNLTETPNGRVQDGTPQREDAQLHNTPVHTESVLPVALDPALLQPNPLQPRRTFNEESLQELAASIKEHGIIQPIIAEKNGDAYYIVAGERRTRAALLAGLTRVPVIFREFENNKKLEIALIENIQREDLNPIEEARAYQEIMQLSHLNQEETAKRVGKSRSAVANAMRLLQLPEDMQTALEKGSITAGHARAILSLINPADQAILFNRITENNLSVREAELQASQLKNGTRTVKKEQPHKQHVPDDGRYAIQDIEQQFINALGTKVEIKGDLEKGTVHISYFSQADLDALYHKITSKNP